MRLLLLERKELAELYHFLRTNINQYYTTVMHLLKELVNLQFYNRYFVHACSLD